MKIIDDFGFRKWDRIDPGDGRNRFFEVGVRSGVSKNFFRIFIFPTQNPKKVVKNHLGEAIMAILDFFGYFRPKMAKMAIIASPR